MQEYAASSWSDFESWLSDLKAQRQALQSRSSFYVSKFLFRGQSDHTWKLATTLERQYPTESSVRKYYDAAHGAKHQIEAHTGRSWTIPSPPDFDAWLAENRLHFGMSPLALEYLLHLRHHGFPSPYLDWTKSPYIAAYFAFATTTSASERVAIYAYLEFAGGAKGMSSSRPTLSTIGSYLTTHRRHVLQQAQYTVCTIRPEGEWLYTSHQSAFDTSMEQNQDKLWRITIPAVERTETLRYLDQFNLNAFSLFGSEESLMETVAFREFARRDERPGG
jgi:hypothetical protein